MPRLRRSTLTYPRKGSHRPRRGKVALILTFSLRRRNSAGVCAELPGKLEAQGRTAFLDRLGEAQEDEAVRRSDL
jgi:hypothetical protein